MAQGLAGTMGFALGMPQLERVKLPQPREDGPLSVERCISQRRSVRSFREQALSQDDLGQLLWAAQGVTGPDGGRTVPSAGALYPLELYIIVRNVASLAPGVYRYLPDGHELLLRASEVPEERLVEAVLGQDWVAAAAACIGIAAVYGRTTAKYGDRGRRYVHIEAGHAAESLMLQAVALGLATTMVGAFSDDEVGRLYCLSPKEVPLCLIPVGETLGP